MRWTIFIFLFLLPILSVRQAIAAEPATLAVDPVLKALEVRMRSVESFRANCTRTDIHPLTKKTVTFTGTVALQKPDLARLDLTQADDVGKKDADKTQFERFISDGKKVYEYSPRDKLIIVHDLPKNGAADNVLFAMLKGMTAAELKKRFDVKVLADTSGWYDHVYFTPKNEADKQDFKTAVLVVYVKNPPGQSDLTYLPRQIRLVQPNGREVIYAFGEIQPNAKLDGSLFKPSGIPGYNVKSANAPPSPKAP